MESRCGGFFHGVNAVSNPAGDINEFNDLVRRQYERRPLRFPRWSRSIWTSLLELMSSAQKGEKRVGQPHFSPTVRIPIDDFAGLTAPTVPVKLLKLRTESNLGAEGRGFESLRPDHRMEQPQSFGLHNTVFIAPVGRRSTSSSIWNTRYGIPQIF